MIGCISPSLQIHNIKKIWFSKEKKSLPAKGTREEQLDYEVFNLVATTESGEKFYLSVFSKDGPIEVVQKEDK